MGVRMNMDGLAIAARPHGDCIEWTRYRNPKGYGQGSYRGRVVLAHRAAWEDVNGPIPEGMCVLHRCDNPSCVNVAHLFLGTRADNNADCFAKGRLRPGHVTGEQHGKAVLTEDAVRAIRARRFAGETLARLAADYGVSPQQIRNITLRRQWRHI